MYLHDNLLKAVNFVSYIAKTNPTLYDNVIKFILFSLELSLMYKVLFKTLTLFSLLFGLK